MSKQSSWVNLPDEDILEQCCLLPDFTGATEKKEDMSEYERFEFILKELGYKSGYFANRRIFFKDDDSTYDVGEHNGAFFMIKGDRFLYEKEFKTEEQLREYCELTASLEKSRKELAEGEEKLKRLFRER